MTEDEAAPPTTHRLLVRHAVAMAVVMVGLLPVVGWHSVFSSDEGAAIVQAQALADDGSFTVPHPFPEADPMGAHFPLEKSGQSADGFSPLPKKPAYTVLLAGADRVAGVPGMIVLSIAGTVGAALAAAALARRLDPRLALTAFWLAGLASPLLTDGYLIIAHTVGAAVCGFAVVLALRARERPSPTRLLAVAVLVAAAGCLRAEAVLFGVALAGGITLAAWAGRRVGDLLVAGAVMAGVVGGWVLDRAWTAAAFGTDVSIPSTGGADGEGFVGGRLRGMVTTWLRPGYVPGGATSVLLVVLALVGLRAAWELRRPAPNDRDVRLLSGLVVGCALGLVATCVLDEPQVVPGLLLTFPALAWGLLLIDRATLSDPVAVLLGGTFSLFSLAVLATQYSIGGAWEWGGRYFALGLPVVVPLVAAGLHRGWRRIDGTSARVCVAAVATSSLALSGMGISAVAWFRDGTQDFVEDVVETALDTQPGDGGTPVVVTTERELPRTAWAQLDRTRWLLALEEDVSDVLDQVRDVGIDELVLVTRRDSAPGSIAASGYRLADPDSAPAGRGAWWITTLRLR